MVTTNISVFRKNLFSSVESVIEFNNQILISTKKGNAVLISEEDYNAILETLYLCSNPSLVKNIKDGEKESINEMKTYNPNEEW